jgi:hypothetical protein
MSSGTVAAKSGPTFEGTSAQQELAAKAFDLMRRQGMLYAADAPIVAPLDRLVQGLSRSYPKLSPDKLRAQVQEALAANGSVFTRREAGGVVSYETTKSGQSVRAIDQSRHMFRQRLNADAREVTEEESRELTEGWIAQAQARSESFTIFQEPAAEAAVAGRWQGPAEIAAFVAPTQPVTYDLPPMAPTLPPILPPMPSASPLPTNEDLFLDLGLPSAAFPSEPVTMGAPAPAPAPAEPALVETEAVAPPVAEEPVVAPAPVAPAPAPVAPPPPPAPVVPARPARYVITTPEGPQTVNLTTSLDETLQEYGPQLEEALGKALAEDFRFASFGGDWYPEEHVERFSKGDFRRIKDYLIETQDALSDRAFLGDVLNRRENDPDYERLRFSLNYRMLREKKDFEFVGVANDRLWIVAGASPVSAPKRKPSELGQDYRFLEDAAARALEPAVPEGVTRWDHALTYYEYENGLLPYNDVARALLPRPMLDEQRAALLRIELPALFQSFPVELRYPTGARGGYIVGFDAFFQENLVPGATFSLEPTDQRNVFVLRFERTAAQEDSLLQYDERRSRFNYRPTTFYAAVSPDWVLSQKRFPQLDGLKRLDEADRKKAENIVAKAFELIGEDVDGRLLALLTDLLPVVNLERPFSEGALRAVLEAHPYFEADPDTQGAFLYDPSKR